MNVKGRISGWLRAGAALLAIAGLLAVSGCGGDPFTPAGRYEDPDFTRKDEHMVEARLVQVGGIAGLP